MAVLNRVILLFLYSSSVSNQNVKIGNSWWKNAQLLVYLRDKTSIIKLEKLHFLIVLILDCSSFDKCQDLNSLFFGCCLLLVGETTEISFIPSLSFTYYKLPWNNLHVCGGWSIVKCTTIDPRRLLKWLLTHTPPPRFHSWIPTMQNSLHGQDFLSLHDPFFESVPKTNSVCNRLKENNDFNTHLGSIVSNMSTTFTECDCILREFYILSSENKSPSSAPVPSSRTTTTFTTQGMQAE